MLQKFAPLATHSYHIHCRAVIDPCFQLSIATVRLQQRVNLRAEWSFSNLVFDSSWSILA